MEAIKRAQPSKNNNNNNNNNNRRGFYVKMKFLNNNSNNNNRQEIKSKTFFFIRYYKWLLWLCLTLYFFSPYFIPTQTQTNNPLTSHPRKASIIASRALIEQNPSHDRVNSIISDSLLNNLKIYIYDLPTKFNADWLVSSGERCSSHLFASEVAIHRALSKSHVRTLDPYEADFFFVPVYVSCNFSSVNGFPAIGHAKSLISKAVDLISSEHPFWNRSRGSDHIFVASHDFGACFHTMENVAVREGIAGFMRRSIVLQTFGVKKEHPCQDVEHVVIPPYVSPEILEKKSLGNRRDIFAFFRGKMEVHPKNVSGQFYSKKVRTEILRRFGNDRRFYLRRHRFAGYQSEIVRSRFCLCPLGWAPWSPRLVESVALGCVPVIIADDIQLPFPTAIPWPKISLTVPERHVSRLGSILEHVAATNLSAIQINLADPAVRRALLFHSEILRGDATWQVMSSLAEKLDRSHRRRIDAAV